MINLNSIKNIYFLGIGGIGMSALARYFKESGKNVAGYDRTPTELTGELEKEGLAIHFEDSPTLIPQPFRTRQNTLVVFTPAIPPDHTELAFFRENNFAIFKRSEILGQITKLQKTIAVAGTHGKTTVSTMIAHILTSSGLGCNAFLGGISNNFKSNIVLDPKSEWVVAEADEFDRSFLRLYPRLAVVTATDADHLDIYGNTSELHAAFNQFIAQIHKDGTLLMKMGLPLDKNQMPDRVFSYSLREDSDFCARNIRLNKKYFFDLKGPGLLIKNISLIHPGLVNVENAVAASAVASLLGIEGEKISKALENFSGIQRRFDYRVNTDDIVYIDDYAHHPKELEATILSVRELYPDRKITGVFQPHLYSRTRDFADEFAKSLSLLDELILLEIYPARELPIPGVSSEMIFRRVSIAHKHLCTRENLLEVLKSLHIEILITLGAGDIDKLVEPIAQLYS